jgi:hypothetical protein
MHTEIPRFVTRAPSLGETRTVDNRILVGELFERSTSIMENREGSRKLILITEKVSGIS